MSAKERYKPCKMGGPFCVGMEAMLEAEARRGLQVSNLMQFSTGTFRSVVTHASVWKGTKKTMVLTYCPCCRARIYKAAKPKAVRT